VSIKGTTPFSRYNRQFFFPTNKSDEFEKIFMSWFLITCLAFMITGAGMFIDWGVFCTNAAVFAVSQMALLDGYRQEYTSLNSLGESVGEVPFKYMLISYIPYAIACTFFAALSCLLVVYVSPSSEGSGIPDVKSYLNGVHLKGLFSIRTLFAKAVGCAFSIGSGLIAGREGPIIHVGAILGAAFSQGSSEFFQCRFPSYLVKHFRCTEWKRDFAVMGSALGVAAAFIAPMGAVLFAIEEGATVWRQQLTFLSIYGSCLTAFLTSVIKGFIFDHHGSPIIPSVLFGSYRDSQPSVIFRLSDFPYILLLGVLGGIVGASFAQLQRYTSNWRKKYIRVNNFRTIAEVIFVSFLITLFRFWIPYIFGKCVSTDTFHDSIESHELPNTPSPLPYNCADHNANDMGLLFYVPQESALKWILHAPGESIGATPLLAAVCFYFFFCILVFGIAVPSGLFIPAFVIGACYGRLVGLLVGYNTGNYDMITSYAFLGSASALGGITRVTISVAIIALESTGNFGCSLYCYVVVFIAKLFADSFNIGIYDLCIENKDVPFLVDDLGYEGYQLTIDEVMTPVQEKKKIAKLEEKQSTSAELLYTRDRRQSDNFDSDLATTMAKKNKWNRDDDPMAAISAVPFVEEVISMLLDNPNDIDFLVENKTEGNIHGLHGTIERHILNRLLEKRLFGINAELLHPSSLDSAWPNLRCHDSTVVEKQMGSQILKELGDNRVSSVVIDLRPYIDREPAIVLATSSVRKAHSFIREGERAVLVASPKSVNIIGVVRRHDIMPGSLEATLHAKERLHRLENHSEHDTYSPSGTNNLQTKNVFSYSTDERGKMSPVSTEEKPGELELGNVNTNYANDRSSDGDTLSPRSESDEFIHNNILVQGSLEPFEPRFYELLFDWFRNKSSPDNNASSNKFSVARETKDFVSLHNRKDEMKLATEKAPQILSKKALKRASEYSHSSKNLL
jgi:chloride channel 7